jgi:hypothetical protein
MLVFIPGGGVPNANYVATAASIQNAISSDIALWVVIPAVTNRLCIIECSFALLCSPLHNTVESAFTLAASKGWKRGNDKTDIMIAGHSLGGVCANQLMQAYSMPYRLIMVFGSYVTESGKYDLTNYPVPVLTLNAELDGLTSPGKTSIWWKQFVSMSKSNPNTFLNKPVIVLPKQNHSDFCPGYNVPGDIMGEVSESFATQNIGKHVGAYLRIQLLQETSPSSADAQLLSTAIDFTRQLLTPYVNAENLAVSGGTSEVCKKAQVTLSGLPAAEQSKLIVADKFQSSTMGLSTCTTNYTAAGGRLVLNTCSHTDYYSDIDNTGFIPCASQLSCKMVSYDRVAQQLKTSTTKKTCSDVNKQNTALALSMATAGTRARYLAKGRQFCFLADTVTSVGPTWLAESLSLKTNSACMNIQSPRLETSINYVVYPGVTFCKLITPARALDWMMTDSLKAN